MTENEMVLELLDNIRGEMQRGFEGVHTRQDVANGRTNTHDRQIAALEERSVKNVCNVHGERLMAVETTLNSLRADSRKAVVWTSGATAGLLAVAEGLWLWLK